MDFAEVREMEDKGYDADYIFKAVKDSKADDIIAARARRKIPRVYNEELYKERNSIEPMFNTLKHFMRVSTRLDKFDIAYLGVVFIAAILNYYTM